MGRLDGKTAVVTGGADGIGHAIADAMTRGGADGFVGDIDDKKGSAFVADLVKAGRKAEDGTIASHYQLRETNAANYAERTKVNVLEADATVIFSIAAAASSLTSFESRYACTFRS